MAERGRKDLLCRFFVRGFCRDDELCHFSHDTNNAIPIPDEVCLYNLLGRCTFGDDCRFMHLDAGAICSYATTTNQREPTFSSSSVTAASHQYDSLEYPDFHSDVIESQSSSNYRQPSEDSGFGGEVVTSPLFYLPIPQASLQEITKPPEAEEEEEEEEEEIQTISNLNFNSLNDISNCVPSPPTSPLQQPACSSNKTYAQACKDNINTINTDEILSKAPICPYAMMSDECPYPNTCTYIHGKMCDLCNRLCLHPYNLDQQKQHRDECVREHEREMELSFAIQRSIDKACGICMDIIMEKEPLSERRFGILEKCTHIFCLSCIRKWRQTKQFDNKTIRSCPECRVSSDFVVPSKYWVEAKEDKDQLIESYKQALASKPCKYFKEGRGECPFAGACFYQHAYPDGTKAEMPPPRPRRRQNQDGDIEMIRDMLLHTYLEVRDERNWFLTLDLDDVFDMHEMGLFSETDDESEFSEYGDNLLD